MKVILEAQHAVGNPQPRGGGYYALYLIQALLKRNKYDYGLTFFDYNREMGNRLRAGEYFGEYGVPFYECNSLDYRVATRNAGVYDNASYNDYTGAKGDVFHFMDISSIPTKLEGSAVVTIHDLLWLDYKNLCAPHVAELRRGNLERLSCLNPIVTVNSIYTQSEVHEHTGIPKEDIHIVYHAYDNGTLFPDRSGKAYLDDIGVCSGQYIFYIGAIERRKNIIRIIQAFNRIADKFKDLRLVLAGKPTWDDPSETYEAIKASLFADRIIMPGYVEPDKKRILYSHALCFVFPSIGEGFGVPVVEAMACGCPVVTSNTTSLPEVAGEAARLVNPFDVENLAFEMKCVIESSELRLSMIEKGLVQSRKFTWDKCAGATEKIYKIAGR